MMRNERIYIGMQLAHRERLLGSAYSTQLSAREGSDCLVVDRTNSLLKDATLVKATFLRQAVAFQLT